MNKNETLPYAVFKSISDVPQPQRRLNDTPLSVDQVNWINRRAWELREERTAEERVNPEGVTVPGGVFTVENAQRAREEFRDAFEIIDGQWVQMKGLVN